MNGEEFKKSINAQVDSLIELIEGRRRKLLEFVGIERDNKRQVLRDQISRTSSHLNKTTGIC